MATFYKISQDEMEDLLYNELSFPEAHNPLPVEAGELVYGRGFKLGGHSLSLRVYTSIIRLHGAAREVGSDAIRVSLLLKRPDGEIRGIGKARRVNRTTGWRKNLTKRIKGMIESINDIVTCPKCGLPMAKRSSTNGDFMGCTGYPDCKGTKNIA